MRKLSTLKRIVLAALLALAPAVPATALSVSFVKVVDTSTAIPGGSGSFTSFGRRPAIDGGHVVFRGSGEPAPTPIDPAQQGIYSNVGGLQVVADQSTAIPGGAGSFETFTFKPSPDGAAVAWNGDGVASQEGIYRDDGSGAALVADRATLLPGGAVGEFFDSFVHPPVTKGGATVFHAVGDGGAGTPTEGIYGNLGGPLAALVDSNTTIPGTAETFSFLSVADFDGSEIAFRGSGASGHQGVYRAGAGLALVADSTTGVPGSPETFSSFGGEPGIDGGDVVFRATDTSGLTGLYLSTILGLSAVADETTAIPEAGGSTFNIFGNHAIDGGTVVFKGIGAPGSEVGIYTNLGGGLQKVIDLGDSLDGKTLIDLDISVEALSGSQLTFWARFSNGSEGVFVATIPEPGTALLMGLGLALLGAKRRTTWH